MYHSPGEFSSNSEPQKEDKNGDYHQRKPRVFWGGVGEDFLGRKEIKSVKK